MVKEEGKLYQLLMCVQRLSSMSSTIRFHIYHIDGVWVNLSVKLLKGRLYYK